MKYRPRIWSITWRYLIVALIIIAAAFGFSFSIFFKANQETGQLSFITTWGFSQYFIVILVPVVLIGFYILSVTQYYYVIDSKTFSLFRFGKEFVFDYKSIEFIDIEESKRKKQVIFYSPKSRTKYLLADKGGVLLDTLIKKCPNTLTVQEFRRAHPEERY